MSLCVLNAKAGCKVNVSKVDSRYFADVEAVKGVDPAVEHSRPFRTETPRLRVWGLRGENTTLLWCRDKSNTWENELVLGKCPNVIAGEKIPFRDGFMCYFPWENRWESVGKGGILPGFTRSIVVRISSRGR